MASRELTAEIITNHTLKRELVNSMGTPLIFINGEDKFEILLSYSTLNYCVFKNGECIDALRSYYAFSRILLTLI